MLAPHTADALLDAARLVNTAAGARGGQQQAEQITSAQDLSKALPGQGFKNATPADLKAVRALRTELTGVWEQLAADAPATDVQERLNALIAAHGPARLELTSEGKSAGAVGEPARWVLGEDEQRPGKRLGARLVMAVAEAALAGELDRLRICAGEDCENALVDTTRNHSKQFCDEANCANRTHVKAYRRRRAQGGAAAQTEQVTSSAAKTGAEQKDAQQKDAVSSQDVVPAINVKISRLSTELKNPDLSKKERKKIAKKFKKLRKKLKDSADLQALEEARKRASKS